MQLAVQPLSPVCRALCQTLLAPLGQQPLQTARMGACHCSALPQPLWWGNTQSLQRQLRTPPSPSALLPQACQTVHSRFHLLAPGSLCLPLRRRPAGGATPSQGQQQQQDLSSNLLLLHLMAVQHCRVLFFLSGLGSRVGLPASLQLAELPIHHWMLPRNAPRQQGVAKSPRGW